jgi:hypothetical protein
MPTATDAPAGRITDRYESVLRLLPPSRRRSYLLRLTHGFCEGWRPSRSELTDEVAADLGLISWTEVDTRRRDRWLGPRVRDLTPGGPAWARSLGRVH